MLAGVHLLYYAGWTHDDPFITFRYVKNVASGDGFVFNKGERLEGYSNFLFSVMLLPAQWAGVGLLAASKLYGFLFALGSVILFFVFISGYYENLRWEHLLAVFLLALSGDVALWAVSGLETALEVFFVTGAWIFFSREMRSQGARFPLSALCLLGAALNRPEGGLYFFALAIYAIIRVLRKSTSARYLTTWLITFLLPYGVYNLWRFLYFGQIFPNSFYAKATGGLGIQILVGVSYLWAFVKRNPYWLLTIIFLPAFLRKRWGITRWSAAVLIGAQAVFIITCGGDWMPLGRFVAPVLPAMFFLFQEGLFDTMAALKMRDAHFRLRDALGLLCAMLIVVSLVQERRATRPIMYSVKTHTLYRPHIEIGLWLRKHVPANSLLAGEEAGIIPYYSGLRFLDLLGIVDAHIAHAKGAMHKKFDVGYVLSRKPDYILLYTLTPVGKGTHLQARLEGGRLLMASDGFRGKYSAIKSFPHGNKLIGHNYVTLFKRR